MSPAATAAASTLSLPGFPRWSVWLLLLFFLASTVVIGVLLARARRRAEYGDDDPWPGWQHHDGKDAYEAATDPGLTAIDAEPGGQMTLQYGVTEPVADITSFDLPAITGEVVTRHNWAQAMTVPAPAPVVRPVPVEQAEQWISQWELDEKVRATLARADAMFAGADR